MYDIEDIYEWLDYVRRMGLEQSFDKCSLYTAREEV